MRILLPLLLAGCVMSPIEVPIEDKDTFDCIDAINNHVNQNGIYEWQHGEGNMTTYNVLKEPGDCEDFAYTKQKLIRSACWRTSSEIHLFKIQNRKYGHAVLVVNEKYVLDNTVDYIYKVEDIKRYHWVDGEIKTISPHLYELLYEYNKLKVE